MSAAARIAALTYHEVTDDPTTTGFQRPYAVRYAHAPPAFEAHLEAMAGAGLRPSLVIDADLARTGRYLLLTFDDGGKSALRAAELLARHEWKAHFFVVADRIGTRTFLARNEVRQLRACGHLVGSHSQTHPDIFRDLPRARMLGEWRTSCAELSDLLGEPCVAASVPGGDISHAVLTTAAEVGLQYLFTSEPSLRPGRVGGCWVLGRVCLRAGASPATACARAEGRGWAGERLERQLKEIARRALPPLYRRYVRHLVDADATATPSPSRRPQPPSASP